MPEGIVANHNSQMEAPRCMHPEHLDQIGNQWGLVPLCKGE